MFLLYMKISLVGYGFVGKATSQFSNNMTIYDINSRCCYPKGTTLNDLHDSDIIFICLPTPMNKNGSVHTQIVEDTVIKLQKIVNKNCSIIIRSTVPPGTSDRLNTFFMPEFLTEKHYLNDFVNNENWIIGKPKNHTENQINNIIQMIKNAKLNLKIRYQNITILENKEAEMVKYFRNTFLSLKVGYCNEIYQYCKKQNINYDNMIKAACTDNRITDSHTNVPGPDGKFGFGGTCFPKDCNGLLYEFQQNNIDSYILKSAINRNNNVDRVERDWENDIGRTVIN